MRKAAQGIDFPVRRRTAMLAAALAFVPIATGCGLSGDDRGGAGDIPTIRIGWMFPGAEPLYIMQTHPELLKGAGTDYKVDWNQVNGSSEAIQGIAAGTLDAGVVGSVSVLNGYEKGIGISLLAEMSEERKGWGASWYFARTGIKSIEQLRGKKVGVNVIGSGVDLMLRAYLSEHGMKAGTDYQVVAIPFATMLDSLQSGDIALGALPAPFDAAARQDSSLHILFSTADVQSPFVQVMLGIDTKFAAAHSEAVQSFMTDFRSATTWLLAPQNRTTAIADVAKLTKIPAKNLSYLLDPAKGSLYLPPAGKINVAALQANWSFLARQGFVSKDYQVTDYLIAESPR